MSHKKTLKLILFVGTIVWAIFVVWCICQAEEPNLFTESWSVGPERFFKDGREVPQGTPGAISGDELARGNLRDDKEEFRKTEYQGGWVTAGNHLSWWQRELIEAEIEYLKNPRKIIQNLGTIGNPFDRNRRFKNPDPRRGKNDRNQVPFPSGSQRIHH